MKLALLFLAMDALTLLSYPFLYVSSKIHPWTKCLKQIAGQVRRK